MLNATEFTYDGIPSSQYELKIASFNSDNTQEVQYLSPAITAVKSKKSKRFFYAGVSYENLPTYTFSVLKDTQGDENFITDQERREILGWLMDRKGFKDLLIHQPDRYQYIYRCIFSDVQIIYRNGYCVGFTLTATFDSPYCYFERLSRKMTSDGADYVTYTVDNTYSDLWDDYTYPIIKFKPTGLIDTDKLIRVYNETDDVDGIRNFTFTGTSGDLNAEIVVDNEFKTIEGTGVDLNNFNKNWLRLRHGVNILKVKINGTFEVSVRTYMKMGF